MDKYLLNDHFLLGPQAGVWEGGLSVDRRGQGKGTNWRKGQEGSEPGEPWGAKAFPRQRVHWKLRQKASYEFEYNLGGIVICRPPAWALEIAYL